MTAITDWRDALLYAYNSTTDFLATKLMAGTNLIGKVGIDQVTANANEVVVKSITAGANVIGTTKDGGPSWTTVLGVSGAAVVSADATGNPAVTDAPTSGQKIVVDDIMVSSDTAMNIIFSEETSGTVFLKVFIPANGFYQITPRSKIKLATANKKLMADASVAGNVAITVLYHSEL